MAINNTLANYIVPFDFVKVSATELYKLLNNNPVLKLNKLILCRVLNTFFKPNIETCSSFFLYINIK